MYIANRQAHSKWNEPSYDKRRDSPARDRNIGEYAHGDNGEGDNADQRLVKQSLQQHQREIAHLLQLDADDKGSHLKATLGVDVKNRVTPADTSKPSITITLQWYMVG